MKQKNRVASLLILVAVFAAAFYFYPQMPEKMASHWNAGGQVDGWSSRAFGTFFMPVLLLLLYGLLEVIPKVAVFRKNIQSFIGYYDGFKVVFLLFMAYVYALTLYANLGHAFNMSLLMPPAVAALLFYAGVLTEHAKRNFFIGVRTPWTLASDEVWKKTNQLGGKILKWLAVAMLLPIAFPDYTLWIIMVPILSFAVFIVAYSLWLYKKIGKPNFNSFPY